MDRERWTLRGPSQPIRVWLGRAKVVPAAVPTITIGLLQSSSLNEPVVLKRPATAPIRARLSVYAFPSYVRVEAGRGSTGCLVTEEEPRGPFEKSELEVCVARAEEGKGKRLLFLLIFMLVLRRRRRSLASLARVQNSVWPRVQDPSREISPLINQSQARLVASAINSQLRHDDDEDDVLGRSIGATTGGIGAREHICRVD